MTPQLGETIEACSAARIEHDARVDFEGFLHFSVGTVDKYKVTYDDSQTGTAQRALYLMEMTAFAGTHLERLVIDETADADRYVRTFDISGVRLIETTLVDDDGVAREVSYEAALVEPETTSAGSLAVAASLDY